MARSSTSKNVTTNPKINNLLRMPSAKVKKSCKRKKKSGKKK